MKNSDIKSLSLVLPTYNELKNIKILIPLLQEIIKKEGYDGEIIVVDDESPDGTADAAEALNRKYGNVRVIRKNNKEGIGAALVVGYDAAEKDLILSMDTDLSFDHNDIVRFVSKINEGYDLVLGSRHMNSDHYKTNYFSTAIKRFISTFGNKLATAFLRVKVHDLSANFRAIRRNVWEKLNTSEKTNSFLVETVLAATSKGYSVTEIPVIFKDRIYGESKINFMIEAPKVFLKLIKLKRRYK